VANAKQQQQQEEGEGETAKRNKSQKIGKLTEAHYCFTDNSANGIFRD
jgi:hypothetical protein